MLSKKMVEGDNAFRRVKQESLHQARTEGGEDIGDGKNSGGQEEELAR